jgi:hypothetical protein
LGIGRSTISAIIKKWRQDFDHFETVERRPGSGGRRISIRNQDEQLLTVIRNSPFTTATAAVNISNFPGSVKTSRRRLRNTELRNHAAARLCSQTKRSSSRRTMVVYRVYRPRNSRYDERYVEPTERFGRFSVNVWG